jgi:hypothetical protein
MSNGCCNDCDGLGLPVGPTGPAGKPAFIAISCIEGGAAFVTSNSVSFSTVQEIVFSTSMADPFDALKYNVWVSGGTGSFRIRDKVTNTVIYQNTNITSTSNINIETDTGQSIMPSAGAILAIEVKAPSSQSISIGSVSLYYEQ